MTLAGARAGHEAVLTFWFGAPDDPGYGQPRKTWFQKSDEFDAQIRQRFGELVDHALKGGIDDWASDLAHPERPLAAIIVFDQFTRNLYRGTARMLAGDEKALGIARAMVDTGADQSLLPVQRQFCYLPFEHAEDPHEQERSVALFTSLKPFAETADVLDWAIRHRDVIDRFGRFPHRNAMLGRESTPAELAYLAEPGSGF